MKNIIFDLGSVILKGKGSDFLKEMNIDENTYNELRRFFKDTIYMDIGKETLEEKYNRCGFSKEYDILYKDILIHYYKYRKLNLDIVDLINLLKENGYDTYVLSNNNKGVSEYFRKHDLLKNIDHWLVSCDYGLVKPDDRFFQALLNEFNLVPDECYFIDDKECNIEAAKKNGIKGYVFDENDDIKKLYKNMRNNNIKI